MKNHTHDSHIDVLHKYNFIELKGWLNHLQYIDNEVDKLLNLYRQSIQDIDIPKNILMLFSKRKEANKQLLETVSSYSNTYKKATECQDIQCDMFYLREYEQLQKSYQYHLDKYQRLKNRLYDKAFQKL